MKKTIKIPRILKIQSVKGLEVICIFNNGENRHIDFARLFNGWKVSEQDPEYLLLNENEFRKVELRNGTLSWENAGMELVDISGKKTMHPFEIGPDILYQNSEPVTQVKSRFGIGSLIKKNRLQKGLSQQQLATLSGTSKTYISRVENDQIEPELSTLYKIVEVGLGKKVKLKIE